MTYLKRYVWAAVIAAVASGAASGQTTGLPTTTTTTGGGNTVSGLPGSSTPQNTNAAQVPEIGSTSGGFSQSAVQSSNIIGPYFANPLFQGVPSASATGTNVTGPGGFGTVLFSGTGTAAGGTGGRATTAGARATNTATNRAGGTAGGLQSGSTGTAGRTGATGMTGGLQGGSTLGSPTAGFGGSTGGLQGGTTGAAGRTGGLGATGRAGGLGNTGGLGGLGGGANSTAQQLSTGRQVAYTQTLKFGVPPITTPQLQTDINTLVSTSPTLSGVNGLQTSVADGGLVVVRGKVADEDEARLVEGVIMLTPGVKGVKNELEYPKPPAP